MVYKLIQEFAAFTRLCLDIKQFNVLPQVLLHFVLCLK